MSVVIFIIAFSIFVASSISKAKKQEQAKAARRQQEQQGSPWDSTPEISKPKAPSNPWAALLEEIDKSASPKPAPVQSELPAEGISEIQRPKQQTAIQSRISASVKPSAAADSPELTPIDELPKARERKSLTSLSEKQKLIVYPEILNKKY